MPPDRIVYSTDGGRLDRCSNCRRRLEACVCPTKPGVQRGDGVVRITKDRRNRHGKTVTLISGVPGSETALEELTASLKRLCGSGGALKEGAIEIQGDHRDKLAARLTELGYRVKLAGG
ncbi:MAG: translation initiation factor [Dehalococcoidia bacterium]